ncbi:hypothetical protein AB0G73_06445 [Streptomyces sp. NPDC020719]
MTSAEAIGEAVDRAAMIRQDDRIRQSATHFTQVAMEFLEM